MSTYQTDKLQWLTVYLFVALDCSVPVADAFFWCHQGVLQKRIVQSMLQFCSDESDYDLLTVTLRGCQWSDNGYQCDLTAALAEVATQLTDKKVVLLSPYVTRLSGIRVHLDALSMQRGDNSLNTATVSRALAFPRRLEGVLCFINDFKYVGNYLLATATRNAKKVILCQNGDRESSELEITMTHRPQTRLGPTLPEYTEYAPTL